MCLCRERKGNWTAFCCHRTFYSLTAPKVVRSRSVQSSCLSCVPRGMFEYVRSYCVVMLHWNDRVASCIIYDRNCISGRNWFVIWFFFLFQFYLLRSFRSNVRMNGQTKLMLFLVSLIETASLREKLLLSTSKMYNKGIFTLK